ncbi:MAG: ABC transporter ATP-binding protein [candidate division NC10 bacterium]|nr:ABC transporter ATP-binding protein [candidate division NC10 bacterium]
MTSVEVQGVTFRYRTGKGVEDVIFQTAPGELLGIVGPNSAGKSTLLRLLSKVVAPARGRILIEGRDIAALTRMALAQRLAVVPQEFQVAFPFRVGEVVLMGRYPHGAGNGWGSARDHAVARAAMEATGILDLATRRMDELSGGERQLVSIARALAQEARILLLDEPTAHLDLRHQGIVLEILLRHHREARGTTVLVSHDLNLAAEHCDRLLLLTAGRVQVLGRPEEVITQEQLERAYGCRVTVERHPVSGRPQVRGSLNHRATDDPVSYHSPDAREAGRS